MTPLSLLLGLLNYQGHVLQNETLAKGLGLGNR